MWAKANILELCQCHDKGSIFNALGYEQRLGALL